MTDREKVINGLEWCMNERHDCYREKGCPYENVGDDVGCKYALHRDAIALLKAQEPIAPSPAIDNYGDWLCGKCYNSVVGTEELDEGGFVPIRFNYCPNCGQAVKWE